MSTDIKKAILQVLVSSDDYIHAFSGIQKLSLKKEQQREIIKVLV
jgi:hypothetical protein